jgi:hypothetical protein
MLKKNEIKSRMGDLSRCNKLRAIKKSSKFKENKNEKIHPQITDQDLKNGEPQKTQLSSTKTCWRLELWALDFWGVRFIPNL